MKNYLSITIITFLYAVVTWTSSQYKGVVWNKKIRKWTASVWLNSHRTHGGSYIYGLDAAKRVNELCDKLKIERKNPGVDARPPAKIKQGGTSQYRCVCWINNRKRWKSEMWFKNQHNWSYHVNELDAAKKVNQWCDEFGIKRKNPDVDSTPNVEIKQGGTSKYRGVYWLNNRKQWTSEITFKNHHNQSYHVNELDAAKKVNQWCDEFGIKRKNPDVDSTPNVEEKVKTLLDYGDIQEEFEYLIKILDESPDPNTLTIKENLTSSIHHGKKSTITEINSQTQNGESALSIAAKHGLFNVVKFLISKGANKNHFTNEYQTPLSLAVSQNHLKVVEVLFEGWISPNSHDEPYLHLLPIFNVKSREIAQLLVDNDAMTSSLYNNKNQSPLTVASQNGFLDVVEFFLDDGLDINHSDSDNKTPLFYARTNKHDDVANLLILKGAQNVVL